MSDIMNPREGDVFTRSDNARQIIIDKADGVEVAWRYVDGHGGLLSARRCSLEGWRNGLSEEVGDGAS